MASICLHSIMPLEDYGESWELLDTWRLIYDCDKSGHTFVIDFQRTNETISELRNDNPTYPWYEARYRVLVRESIMFWLNRVSIDYSLDTRCLTITGYCASKRYDIEMPHNTIMGVGVELNDLLDDEEDQFNDLKDYLFYTHAHLLKI